MNESGQSHRFLVKWFFELSFPARNLYLVPLLIPIATSWESQPCFKSLVICLIGQKFDGPCEVNEEIFVQVREGNLRLNNVITGQQGGSKN